MLSAEVIENIHFSIQPSAFSISRSPGPAAGRRRPHAHHLPYYDDLTEVVGIVIGYVHECVSNRVGRKRRKLDRRGDGQRQACRIVAQAGGALEDVEKLSM